MIRANRGPLCAKCDGTPGTFNETRETILQTEPSRAQVCLLVPPRPSLSRIGVLGRNFDGLPPPNAELDISDPSTNLERPVDVRYLFRQSCIPWRPSSLARGLPLHH